MRTPRLALAAVFALAATVLVACGGGGEEKTTGAAQKGGEIRIGLSSGSVDHMDPALAYFATTWGIQYATCTRLIQFQDAAGEEGKKLVAGLAELPTVSADGKIYTFKLRSGAKFSNGAPVTGEDIKATFLRLLDPKMASPGGGFFAGLVGAQDVIDGKAQDLAGITTGADSITFTLAQPDGSFLKRLSMPFTCPVPTGTPAKAVEDGSLPTTGPYKVDSYTPSRELVLTRNENYDAALLGDRGKADTIRFPIGIDGQQAALKIKSGELDLFLEYLPGTDATQALNDPSLEGRAFSNPAPSVMYLWMNNQVPPFDNADVRKAVNYAIDRTQIVKVWGGPATAKATDQILPPTTAGWTDTDVYPLTPDVAKAKELMQQSGLKTPVKVVLHVRNDAPGFVEMAQVAQANLKEIGIDVEIKGAPDAVNEPIITNPKTRSPMGINQWTEDYPDGDSYINTLLDPRRPEYSQNKARFGEASLRSAFDAMGALTGDERDKAWQDLDAQVMGFAPWAPLFNPLRVDIISDRVTNYVYQPVYGPSLTQLAVKG